jgi:hypothetical protein
MHAPAPGRVRAGGCGGAARTCSLRPRRSGSLSSSSAMMHPTDLHVHALLQLFRTCTLFYSCFARARRLTRRLSGANTVCTLAAE